MMFGLSDIASQGVERESVGTWSAASSQAKLTSMPRRSPDWRGVFFGLPSASRGTADADFFELLRAFQPTAAEHAGRQRLDGQPRDRRSQSRNTSDVRGNAIFGHSA